MEIEKEVKKITLGHEIGAGAACLKCKDKCEGFDLHFWRKICRNCKCGVEDHDVQLETEENKKVGRLFEDTKYTGLIAKLKRDGIPSYKGNQVTFRIPAASISTATPVPASAFVPGSSQIYTPNAQSTHAPPGAATAVPGASIHSPTAPATGRTASSGTGHTAASGIGHSDASGTGRTAASGIGHTAASGTGHIDTSGTGRTAALGTGHSASIPSKGRGAATTAVPIPTAVPAKTDVVKSVTYEWAPPGINQGLALLYMELLPPERRPIAGSAGADYRKKQMAKQLPDHDQDPERCHELSPSEVKQMQQYVRKYKDEALGIGDITLPEEMGLQAEEKGPQCVGAGGKPGTPGLKGDAVGTMGKVGTPGADGTSLSGPAGNYSCHRCQLPMKKGEPAVYAERAGYDKLWHPACFVCCNCSELLVDMIYFWKKDKLYCGRHYGDSEKPRCAGCDELIFSNEYTQAEGHDWHLKHFCCFHCDCVLAGETYVMEKDKPVCKPCYMKNHAVCCAACQNPIEPEAQRVAYGEHHWHAEPQCFQCSCCSKCLMGQRFMALQGMLLCSVECKKKIMAS
ncbi:testin [Pimephales promelas]|uniref:testin n=1 Tax=Pimephales promelas TaxID=90988 RepID=UPI001955B092|nr:testin [Pimephales promelas]KAG1939184.1 prickle-like protein [Pimephales promelas]